MATLTAPEVGIEQDAFPINGTDYVEFYVGNAKQASHFYRAAFGYSLVAYCGPETGVRDRASYPLQQGKIRLVLTTAMSPDSPIAAHVHRHGDGVRDYALWVDDARQAYARSRTISSPSSAPATRRRRGHWPGRSIASPNRRISVC